MLVHVIRCRSTQETRVKYACDDDVMGQTSFFRFIHPPPKARPEIPSHALKRQDCLLMAHRCTVSPPHLNP